MKHVRLQTVSLRRDPRFNEKWLHDVICQDPTILGLGELIVKDRERIQPGAGRLDILLQDEDGPSRYEVEIQLGPTDETHIVRTLEYWDIERRRYPQYEHTAVIIAEDITSRFLNVISLFNGFIPVMALKLTAIETPEGIGLQFTRVLDTVRLGLVEEDEEVEPVDRAYWETKRGTPATVKLVDSIVSIVKEFAPNAEPSYNKHYIGFKVDGKAFNFATCRPQKASLKLSVRSPQSDDLSQSLESSGLDMLEYDKRWGAYKMKLDAPAIQKHRELLRTFLEDAYQLRV